MCVGVCIQSCQLVEGIRKDRDGVLEECRDGWEEEREESDDRIRRFWDSSGVR